MSTYRIYLAAEASQTIEVEADTYAEACQLAFDQSELHSNVTNRFDIGDVEVVRSASYVGDDEQPIPASEPDL